MTIRSGFRLWLERHGVYLRRVSQLPLGIDWARDASRFVGHVGKPIVFDIGANVGQTALELHRVFRTGQIFSFEPVPSTCALLRSAVAALPRVSVHQLAMDERAGVKRVMAVDGATTNSLAAERFATDSAAREVEFHCATVDTFCLEHDIQRIAVLKTDTEGFDAQVLRGAERMFEAGAVDACCCEVTFNTNSTTVSQFSAVAPILERHGMVPVAMYSQEAAHFGILGAFCDVLFVHRRLLKGLSSDTTTLTSVGE